MASIRSRGGAVRFIVRVRCVWCGGKHVHGLGDVDPMGEAPIMVGLRASHCRELSLRRGYYIYAAPYTGPTGEELHEQLRRQRGRVLAARRRRDERAA